MGCAAGGSLFAHETTYLEAEPNRKLSFDRPQAACEMRQLAEVREALQRSGASWTA
jgi:hypothetical protein